MGISDMHVIPMIITCMLQGTLCNTGIPCTFYGENICSVAQTCYYDPNLLEYPHNLPKVLQFLGY